MADLNRGCFGGDQAYGLSVLMVFWISPLTGEPSLEAAQEITSKEKSGRYYPAALKFPNPVSQCVQRNSGLSLY